MTGSLLLQLLLLLRWSLTKHINKASCYISSNVLVTNSDALVTSSFLLLVGMH